MEEAQEASMYDTDDQYRTWRRSSRCSNAACIEIALSTTIVSLRDSEDPAGNRLDFAAPAWRAFLDEIRNGRLDVSRAAGDAAA